jgi:hypothetical protein
LVSRQVGVFCQAKKCAIAKDGLVENLEKIDPNQDNENDPIGFASYTSVLQSSLALELRLIQEDYTTYILFCQFHSVVSDDGLCSVGMLQGSSAVDHILGELTGLDVFGMSHVASFVVNGSHVVGLMICGSMT